MKYFSKIVLFILMTIGFPLSVSALKIAKTTCELSVDPLTVSVDKPRFGWQLQSSVIGDKQTAYELVVSSESAKSAGDIWKSGKIKSDNSQFVYYAGTKPLEKGKSYRWQVRVWDAKGKASEWSAAANFSLAPDDVFLDAKWIGAITKADAHLPIGQSFHLPSLKKKENLDIFNAIDSLALRSILLRKIVNTASSIRKATVYISGLGHYQLTINGKKVGESEFAPLWSDYGKTVYYNIYRVDTLLTKGNNALGVILGNGFYNAVGNRYHKLWRSYGPPTLFFKMVVEYADGSSKTIYSDKSWKYSLSPITFNDIYGGESYDACLEQEGWNKPGFDDKAWRPVVLQEAPEGRLTAQTAPPVIIHKQYGIKEMTHPSDSVYILNMGQNLSGFPTIKVKGKRGQTIRMYVAELLDKNGNVNQKRSGAPFYFEYTLKGSDEEEWHPLFSYYGYQYIRVEGADVLTSPKGSALPLITDVKSNFVYNSASETGTFECSNEIFTRAHWLINNSIKSNFQAVMTDCPHREKLGWIEEVHLNGPGLMFNYDMSTFFPKVLRDMSDAQRPDGLVPSICPEYVVFGGDFSDSPEWGCASVVVPWMYYEYYGDPSMISRYYGMMKKYVDYLGTKAKDHILSYGLGDWYDYGEKPAGYSQNSSIAISATSHYYFSALLVDKAAKLLGDKVDIEKYGQLVGDIKTAYNKRFFNTQTKQYDTGSQFANAVSIYLDLVESQNKQGVLDNLVADIRNHGTRLTTGDVGNRYLFQVLANNGLNELMYKMVNHYDAPGYGFQLQYGLTTLTEQWDPRKGNSWNHFMMGQIEEWFFRTLAGINPDMDCPGFKHIIIKPVPVGDMTSVHATHESLYGTIDVEWHKTDNQFELNIRIPVNSTATVILPGHSSSVMVNGKQVKIENDKLPVGSGEYKITATK